MRRALRLLAAVVVGGSIVVAPIYVVAVTLVLGDTAFRRADLSELVVYGALPVLLLGLLACVAGILLCVTEVTLPLPTPPLAGRRAGRGLRVLAAVQLFGGIATAVLTTAALAWKLLSSRTTEASVFDLAWVLVATFGVLALACVGGLLWCAVRVAYARPADAQSSG